MNIKPWDLLTMEVPRKLMRFYCPTCNTVYNRELICHGETVIIDNTLDVLLKQKTKIMNKPYSSGNNSGEELKRITKQKLVLNSVHEGKKHDVIRCKFNAEGQITEEKNSLNNKVSTIHEEKQSGLNAQTANQEGLKEDQSAQVHEKKKPFESKCRLKTNGIVEVHEEQRQDAMKREDSSLNNQIYSFSNVPDNNKKIKEEPLDDYENVEKIKISSQEQKYKCRICDFECDNKEITTIHVEMDHLKDKQCGVEFSGEDYLTFLNLHVELVHEEKKHETLQDISKSEDNDISSDQCYDSNVKLEIEKESTLPSKESISDSCLDNQSSFERPKISFCKLISEALNNSPIGMLVLSDIYKAISDKYPYYKITTQNWQNSIRHNLSRDKSFTKAEKMIGPEVETQRGCFWKLASLKYLGPKYLKKQNWKYSKLDNQPIEQGMTEETKSQGKKGPISNWRSTKKNFPLTIKDIVILAILWEDGRPQIFQEFYVMFTRFAYYAERTDKVMWNSTVRNTINIKLVEEGILSQIKLSDEERESIRNKFKNTGGQTTNKYGMFYIS